jgi:tripartite-type tricarboxylate transporter receptor subunit TctC
VLATSPFKTLKDLVEYANHNPVTVGGSGSFSGYHMATLRFEKMIGTRLTYVPYTGAAPQMTSFLGGHIVAVFGAPTPAGLAASRSRRGPSLCSCFSIDIKVRIAYPI